MILAEIGMNLHMGGSGHWSKWGDETMSTYLSRKWVFWKIVM
jgi:hypothetical protein